MGLTNRICLEVGRTTAHLNLLQEAKDRNLEGRASNPANGRVSRLVRQSAHILDVRPQSWMLANRNGLPGQGKQDVAIWTVQIYTNAVRSEKHSKYVPTGYGHYAFNCQMAVCTRILGRCRPLLEVCRRSSRPERDCSKTIVEILHIIETEGMLLL